MRNPFPQFARAPSSRRCFFLITGIAATVLCTFARNSDAASTTVTIRVAGGWNLLSLPVSVPDGQSDSLFPTAVTPPYGFDHGFGAVDTLKEGYGFWVKFGEEETLSVTGPPLFTGTLDLSPGWNLIGAISTPVGVKTLRTFPPGLLESGFFGFTPGMGYREADTLVPGSGYWVKSSGAGVLAMNTFNVPCPGLPLVIAHWGGLYTHVQIGEQCWLGQNIDAGTMISGSLSQQFNVTIEKYCFNDLPENCALYGGLYQWDEMMLYSFTEGARGICPPGWHIPTLGQFQELGATVGGDGNALKEFGQGIGNGAATDASGFDALLGGYRTDIALFYGLSYYGIFWSSTAPNPLLPRALTLGNDDPAIGYGGTNKEHGFSVRCLKD